MTARVQPEFDVVIIGSGFAGMCAAIKLREAGIQNIVVLEKANEVGGTWRENTYPGAGCDVMSLMYSFSFAPNPHWTRGYARQPEILTYLRHVANKYALRDCIRFGEEVVSEVFDDENDLWTVSTRQGHSFTARAVIAGTGPLHIPKIPDLEGSETFGGRSFHSAEWDHSIDFAGKSVAVIGTGASAVQFIPVLADQAKSVRVFQRTPHWVLPKLDRPITAAERLSYRTIPGLRRLVRAGIYFSHEAMTAAFLNPRYMPAVRALADLHLRRQVPDPALRAKLRPEYEVGCKRILIANDYYPALQKDTVSLVTEGIAELTEKGVRTRDGAEHEADIVIYATGFAVTDKADAQQLVGREGRTIQQLWRDGPAAYLGLAVNGLPNYFLVMGPNSGVGNQSVVFMIESQVAYIVACLQALSARECTRVEVKSHVQQQYNRNLQRKSVGTVWTAGGCESWYLDKEGVNRAVWPATTLSYWRTTRTPDLTDFEYTRLEDRDDEDYRGPAVLIDTDGYEIAVQVHLLAVYQPVANKVLWSGRVYPTTQLRELHLLNNQPARIRIGSNADVDAVLVDEDPWGGSHIVGEGVSPYPLPFETELRTLLESADA
ncbi:FAD-dependent oxidoreductase [Antrihabitans sp. YC2-6]|uniref:FAD-dependent oxidoreductase n=1 Tax=Antrihabitans sp. YC2-6 TaxID=2799498 RepID=UPI0018F3B831|nr:FAD-dependent oxidoreductase [Antrihabitans sp. YC2-6]MBJ8346917.1 NAD(P)-binding domain-containing protein [Antrihabitans sp. YC2-6]